MKGDGNSIKSSSSSIPSSQNLAWQMAKMKSEERKANSEKRFLPLFHGHVFIWIRRPLIIRPWTNQAVVVELLDHVRRPPCHTRHGKHRREQIDVDAQGVIRLSRIEVHVRVELAIGDDELLDLARDFEPLGVAAGLS